MLFKRFLKRCSMILLCYTNIPARSHKIAF
nr:MAG TPA: hypothetical protein [Caudoviricetes sp.]